ncbi:MAG: hypothetical protein AB7P03_01245 [Kofleriaceae bacterium]
MISSTPIMTGLVIAAMALTAGGCDAVTDPSVDNGDELIADDASAAPLVTAAELELPDGLTNAHGFIGLMQVDVTGARRFSSAAMNEVLMAGQRLFGDECDGVRPTTWQQIQPVRDPAAAFVQRMRTDTPGWTFHLMDAEIDRLEAYLLGVGDDLRLFTGESSGDTCGGAREAFYTLAWTKATNEVLYLVQYPSSE